MFSSSLAFLFCEGILLVLLSFSLSLSNSLTLSSLIRPTHIIAFLNLWSLRHWLTIRRKIRTVNRLEKWPPQNKAHNWCDAHFDNSDIHIRPYILYRNVKHFGWIGVGCADPLRNSRANEHWSVLTRIRQRKKCACGLHIMTVYAQRFRNDRLCDEDTWEWYAHLISFF